MLLQILSSLVKTWQNFKYTDLFIDDSLLLIAYLYDANFVINRFLTLLFLPFDNIFISDRKQTSTTTVPRKQFRMADTEPKIEEDVLVGEEEGNDEVGSAVAFICERC
jgi:hypothetical protein